MGSIVPHTKSVLCVGIINRSQSAEMEHLLPLQDTIGPTSPTPSMRMISIYIAENEQPHNAFASRVFQCSGDKAHFVMLASQ